MNIHKKRLTFTLFLALWALNAQAQITFGAHTNTALPLFEWRHGYGAAVGAGARFGYNLSDVFAINLSGDYFHFRGQETRLMQKVKVPIHANGEARIRLGRFTPFVGLGAGLTLQRDVTIGFRRKHTTFSANAIGGLNFKVSDRIFLSLSSRFFWDTDSQMQSFSLGFGVGL